MHGTCMARVWHVYGVRSTCTAHAHAHAHGGPRTKGVLAPMLEAREASVRLEARLEHLDRVDAAAAERAASEA